MWIHICWFHLRVLDSIPGELVHLAVVSIPGAEWGVPVKQHGNTASKAKQSMINVHVNVAVFFLSQTQ